MSGLRECVLCGRQGVREFEPAGGAAWRCTNLLTCQRRQQTAEHVLPVLPGAVIPDPDTEPGSSVTATLAGLAREVEALRRAVDQATSVAGRVEDLAAVVARIAEDAAASAEADPGVVLPSWLDFADDVPEAGVLLDGLVEWMAVVYLRYPDAVQGLPACWLWHPDVVEELLWLQRAWLAAYRASGAPVSAAADWHDRLRPGVVRRIKTAAGTCSLENHQPGGDRHIPAPVPPLAEAAGLIASWWAASRHSVAPIPTEEHLAAVATVRSRGGRP